MEIEWLDGSDGGEDNGRGVVETCPKYLLCRKNTHRVTPLIKEENVPLDSSVSAAPSLMTLSKIPL